MATGNNSRQLYAMELCATKGTVVVPGSFQVDTTNDPDNARGDGFVVTYAAVGKYLVTLSELYPGAVSIVATVEDGAAGTDYDLDVSVEQYLPASGSFVVRVSRTTDAVAKALTDVDDLRINFVACLQKYNALNVTHT